MIRNKTLEGSNMPYSRRFYGLLFFTFAILGLTNQFGFAQNDTAQTPNASQQPQANDTQFAEKLWDYLLENNYKHWSPPTGRSVGFVQNQLAMQRNSNNPHGALAKLYVNRVAAGNLNAPPVGSVLIMENYRSDKSLDTISVMYRTSGFNPSSNDWFWVNYKANGAVDAKQLLNEASSNGLQQTFASKIKPKKLAGRVRSCIQCHQSGGADLVFFNSQNHGVKIQKDQQLPNSSLQQLGLKQ